MSARPVGTWFLTVAGIAVVASLAFAITVIGSPAHQRALRFDEQRVADLRNLATRIEIYEQTEHRLPATLRDLQHAAPDASLAVDPQSARAYEYRLVDARHYTLCAVFANALGEDDEPGYAFSDDWLHPAGRHCFTKAVPTRRDAKDAADAAADAAAAVASGD